MVHFERAPTLANLGVTHFILPADTIDDQDDENNQDKLDKTDQDRPGRSGSGRSERAIFGANLNAMEAKKISRNR